MNKNILPIILVSIVFVVGLVAVWNRKPQPPIPAEEEKKPLVTEQFNTLPVKDRPYVALVPSVSGGEIYLSVDHSQDTLLEYEIEYQATNQEGGTLLQGGGGKIDLSQSAQPTAPKEFCFCSESKGKKKYDSGVTGGILTLRFSGGEKGDYSLKNGFTIGDKEEKLGVFSSADAKAKMIIGSQDLSNKTVVVATNTSGLPVAADLEVIEGPYGFFPADNTDATLDNSQIVFQSDKDLANAKIFVLDNKAGEWRELKDKQVKDNTVTASAPFLGIFILAMT